MTASLFNIMSMGSESLTNSRNGIDIAGQNIANAHTPGYSRQQMKIESRAPILFGRHVFGQGARFQGAFRVHDRFLESQIRDELQNRGFKNSVSDGLSRLERLFNPEMTATVRDRMNQFYNSLREMSNYPDEAAARTSVVDSAESLCLAFRTAHTGIEQIQKDINLEVASEVGAINSKLKAIAHLNVQIHELAAGAENPPNTLLDQRDRLVRETCEAIGAYSYLDDYGNAVVRDSNGGLLVDSGHAAQLALIDNDESSLPQVRILSFGEADMHNITREIRSGRLGGLLAVRDEHAQGLRNEVNRLAKDFGESFNAVHAKGYGIGRYAHQAGRTFFEGLDTGGEPAANIEFSAFLKADPHAIGAALTPNSPGDNVVLNELIQLKDKTIFDGGKASLTESYDRFIGELGVNSMRAKEDKSAAEVVMGQLESEREKLSGVSLDEEAADLLKFQQLFSASSKVITTADEMMETIIGLKR